MTNTITNDIFGAITKYGPYGAVSGMLILAIIYYIVRRKAQFSIKTLWQNNKREIITGYFIYVYCFAVISITFVSREPGSREGLDLMLFSTFSHKLEENIYPIENIILFMPFGFLLPILSVKLHNMLYCLILGGIFSTTIEISQYITKRGYCQIDDVMTNIIGTLVGYGIYYWIIKLVDLYKKRTR
jgi:Glycopeptide antibiotics resistance protein